jgi:hypothetical protein
MKKIKIKGDPNPTLPLWQQSQLTIQNLESWSHAHSASMKNEERIRLKPER